MSYLCLYFIPFTDNFPVNLLPLAFFLPNQSTAEKPLVKNPPSQESTDCGLTTMCVALSRQQPTEVPEGLSLFTVKSNEFKNIITHWCQWWLAESLHNNNSLLHKMHMAFSYQSETHLRSWPLQLWSILVAMHLKFDDCEGSSSTNPQWTPLTLQKTHTVTLNLADNSPCAGLHIKKTYNSLMDQAGPD